ncbi:hypothetical protein C8T65DRAFT_655220 [Cerioporus squamosus]|nr:hypothetical protein C8T65DRAFT_655220 [Cerioporus squamosus]
MTATAAWANPYSLHPWFRMPSHKRKELSDEEDAPSTFEPRRSLSPTPSPKRRRCDVLENGMSQLTLDGLAIPPSASLASASYPTILFPDSPAVASHPPPLWADASHASGPNVSHIPTNAATPVILPGSVEEPTSPETVSEDAEVQDVSMKIPSWYEIEKDRTSASLHPSASSASSSTTTIPCSSTSLGPRRTPSPPRTSRKPLFRHPPRPTVVDVPDRDTGIVITDLEDSDAEEESPTLAKPEPASGAPAFTISSALLDRLPKPHSLGPLAPEPSPSTALVLYRPLAVVPDESQNADASPGDADGEREGLGAPMGEEVPMEDTRPCTPMVLEPLVDEPVDEPMDIEML